MRRRDVLKLAALSAAAPIVNAAAAPAAQQLAAAKPGPGRSPRQTRLPTPSSTPTFISSIHCAPAVFPGRRRPMRLFYKPALPERYMSESARFWALWAPSPSSAARLKATTNGC